MARAHDSRQPGRPVSNERLPGKTESIRGKANTSTRSMPSGAGDRLKKASYIGQIVQAVVALLQLASTPLGPAGSPRVVLLVAGVVVLWLRAGGDGQRHGPPTRPSGYAMCGNAQADPRWRHPPSPAPPPAPTPTSTAPWPVATVREQVLAVVRRHFSSWGACDVDAHVADYCPAADIDRPSVDPWTRRLVHHNMRPADLRTRMTRMCMEYDLVYIGLELAQIDANEFHTYVRLGQRFTGIRNGDIRYEDEGIKELWFTREGQGWCIARERWTPSPQIGLSAL